DGGELVRPAHAAEDVLGTSEQVHRVVLGVTRVAGRIAAVFAVGDVQLIGVPIEPAGGANGVGHLRIDENRARVAARLLPAPGAAEVHVVVGRAVHVGGVLRIDHGIAVHGVSGDGAVEEHQAVARGLVGACGGDSAAGVVAVHVDLAVVEDAGAVGEDEVD